MAQSDFDNKKDTPLIGEQSRSKLRVLDAGNTANGSGYVAQVWTNNAKEGELGPYVSAWLNRLEAALANGAAHYTHVPLLSNRDCWLEQSVIQKLNTISAHVASIRP